MLVTMLGGGLLVFLLLKKLTTKKVNLPPGPPGLPFFGNFFQLDQDSPHKTMTKWSETYGNVFTIKLFGANTVVVNDFESIHDVLVTRGTTFAGRPPMFRSEVIRDYTDNIGFISYSPKLLFMKKTALQSLKMYGDNLETLEIITLEMIDDLMEELEVRRAKGTFDTFPFIFRCVSGIIASILYGHKLKQEEIDCVQETVEEGLQLMRPIGKGVFLDVFPWLRFFPNDIYKGLVEFKGKFRHHIGPLVKARKTQRQPGNPACVIDAFYDHQAKATEKQSEFILSDDDIYGINSDLIFAGSFTTSATLSALIAVMVNDPKLQKRISDDIISKLGDRTPRLADRGLLPIVDAAILEMNRYASLLPLNIPHAAMEDTTIAGYDIPKNTQVLTNLWKLHHDPELWDEPWKFKPERFLEEDGSLVPADHPNRKRVLAFGASRRVCVGEVLAKNRLFLMVAAICQKYEFVSAGPEKTPKHDPRDYTLFFGLEPKPYEVKLVPRVL